MVAEKLERFRGRVTFITGGSKNAGKTTFLNYLLPRLRGRGNLVYLTIGIDGEKKDLIFGNDKPAIETKEGDCLVTCEAMMNNSDALFDILHVFPWRTALGRLMLLKTKRSGLIELAGPENNNQLVEMLDTISNDLMIDTILVDGAVNRITQLAAGIDSSFYYVMRLTPDNRASSLEKIRILSILNKVPHINEDLASDDCKYLSGALTSSVLKEIDKKKQNLVIDDFTKVFLSWKELKSLTDDVQLYFRKRFHLEGLIINPYDLETGKLEKELKTLAPDLTVAFNPYKVPEVHHD